MRKNGGARFQKKLFVNVVIPGLLLLALMVFFPTFASAAGDSGGDGQLQAMQTDLMACMQPGIAGQASRVAFSKKYNVPLSKVNENVPNHPPATNGGWSYDTAKFVCTLEYLTVVGTAVWLTRDKMDGYKCGGTPYCEMYSMYCDHYNWQQGCLKKFSPNCF